MRIELKRVSHSSPLKIRQVASMRLRLMSMVRSLRMRFPATSHQSRAWNFG